MPYFHVNAKGQAGPCGATTGRCPFGGADGTANHYESMADAATAAMERELGVIERPLPDTVRTVLEEFAITEEHLSVATDVHGIKREWHREVWGGLSPLALTGLARNASHWKRYHQDAS